MSSPSDRVYSLEQLLQFDSRSSSSAASSSPSRLSTGPNNSIFSAAALSQMRSLFPDIVPDDEEDQAVTSTDADPASRSSDHDNNMDVDSEYDEEYDEDDGFVYGDVVIRGDLHEDIVDRLRQAVHEALSPRAFLASTPATTTIKSTTSSMNNRASKPLSYRSNRPSDLPWRSSHPNNNATTTATMGSNTRGRAVYNHGHYSPPHSASSTSSGSSSYSYHDRRNFGVNLFKQANALHNNNYNTQFAKKTGADSDNWRARESTVASWRNTNVKWNESTSSYVPVAV